MHAKRLGLWLLTLTIFCAAGSTLLAAPPWAKLVPFKHVEAKPDSLYPVSESSGPWMIMATTFSGEGAEDQARELIYELRKKYGLNAYSYQKKFDFSKGIQGRGIDRYGAPQTMKYQRGGEVLEVAVLVGDFQGAGDNDIQKALKRIKFAEPESLKVKKGETTAQSLAALRTIQKQIHKASRVKDDRTEKGPMGHAFVTTNPLLPPEYFVPKGFDKLTLDMNKGVKYSLLDCPEKYTVKVATFTGQVVLDQKKIEQLEQGGNFKSRLAEAGEKAHLLTEALREKGYEAYEFHDRYSSIVTVGAFKNVGTPRPDGKIEINPQIYRVIQTFGTDPTTKTPGKTTPKGKTLVGIAFDLTPAPVEVPSRSISSDYSHTADLR